MEIKGHKVLRKTREYLPPAKVEQTGTAVQSDVFKPTVADPNFPDLSGLAAFSRTHLVGVKDTKMESDDKRVVLLDSQTGDVQDLDVDWSQTGRARDLEAITPTGQPQAYLAVEGSSFQEHKARLFEMKVTEEGGVAEKSHVLPEFGQEIEGLVSLPQPDGEQTVLFGGRGDKDGIGKIFWGTLGKDGLSFTPEGMAGEAVDAPMSGEDRRSIGDLGVDSKGRLWATAAVDKGDNGPFESEVYQVGQITQNESDPVLESPQDGATFAGTKAEALAFMSDGSVYVGSDNESLGGRLDQFHISDQLA